MDLYLLVLVWASTLPLKSTWQLKIGVMLPFLNIFFIDFFVYIDDTKCFFGLVCSIYLFAGMVLGYRLLKSMRTTLQHTYAADIHGLSARLSAKIIAGLPILCYLAMTNVSRIVVEIHFGRFVPLCARSVLGQELHSPRQYCERAMDELHRQRTIRPLLSRYPKTVNEVMLEQEMNAYVANDLKYRVAFFK